jgi:hypothetical protein
MVGNRLLAALASSALLVPAARAQIAVTVDGNPVSFPGQGPAMINGRVLVPLRGVMEKIGASVRWDNATQTVTALSGSRDVRLRIGDEYAMVNGDRVRLDQPAIVLRGTTMVPLRFMGEALGAEVKWDGQTSTAHLTTKGAGNTGGGNAGGGGGAIASVSHSARGWVTVNGRIEVTMTAPTGGRASFRIPGVVEEFSMSEVAAGRYTGSFTVPSPELRVIQLEEGAVVGIYRAGGAEHVAQAKDPVRIDNVKPSAGSFAPKAGAKGSDPRPSVTAMLTDGAGSGINSAGTRLTLDGKDVTAQATVNQEFIAYKPQADLARGKHTAALSLRDVAGNVQTLTWTFEVGADVGLVKSFSHNGLRVLKPGDVVVFNVEAQAKGTATVQLLKNKRAFPLREAAPGKYTAEYTVRGDDEMADETAVVTFVSAGRQTVDFEAPRKVGTPVTAGGFLAPAVLSPRQGATVSSPLDVTGTAPGAAKVEIKVRYRTVLIGGVPIQGTLHQDTVPTDANGKFEARGIDIALRFKGSDTSYTIEVTGVSSSGKKSKTTTVTVKG